MIAMNSTKITRRGIFALTVEGNREGRDWRGVKKIDSGYSHEVEVSVQIVK